MNTGKIIAYAGAVLTGAIKASDGPVLFFARGDWIDIVEPQAGDMVSFERDEKYARKVKRSAA